MGYTKNILGYRGSKTQPPCFYRCWYILTETFYINSSTLETLKTFTNAALPDEYKVEFNNRILNTEQAVPPSILVLAHGKNAPEVPTAPTETKSEL